MVARRPKAPVQVHGLALTFRQSGSKHLRRAASWIALVVARVVQLGRGRLAGRIRTVTAGRMWPKRLTSTSALISLRSRPPAWWPRRAQLACNYRCLVGSANVYTGICARVDLKSLQITDATRHRPRG